MDDHPFGVWSLLPPLVAIVLAIATRRVILSLLLGVFVGVLIGTLGEPFTWGGYTVITVKDRFLLSLWSSLTDADHLHVFAFTLLMGAMVGVISRSGGMHGVVDRIAPLAHNRQRGQLVTWLLGLVIFFDDYANTLLLGGTMRPLADRLKISREKLAYLVDSTAAPVAGLAVVSTWVAGEIGYINSGLEQATLTGTADGFEIFVATIPYRFYVLFALFFVAIVALLGRDFGPMLAAERRVAGVEPRGTSGEPPVADDLGARGSHHSPIDPSHPNTEVILKPSLSDDILMPDHETPHRWQNAVVPIVITVATILTMLASTGAASLADPTASIWAQISQGDSYAALLWGSIAGLAAIVVLVCIQRLLSPVHLVLSATRGALLMVTALVILWMAWSLADITSPDHLQTGAYLGGAIRGTVAVEWMPTVVFVLASLVAFSTGTSWGTMGILTPLVIQVTCELLTTDSVAPTAQHPLLLASIGSVLAGAIFGDHCSPISDTTVLSSQACGCNHVAHVWTQMPYALAVAVVAVVCGTIPVGFGLPVWPMLICGGVVLLVGLRLFGKRAEEE